VHKSTEEYIQTLEETVEFLKMMMGEKKDERN
jgi:hypothetical protein